MNNSQPQNQRPDLRTEVPGPKSRELRRREEKHLAPGLQGFALMAGIVVREARGSAVTDVDGNTYLDFIGGIGVNGLGHSHPKYVNALQDQVARASVGSFTSEARVEFVERLSEHRPSSDLHRVQLYSSGAEAVESAMRLAKCHTGKTEFVSFTGGFHGKTMGVLSLMGSDFKDGFGPFVPGSHIVPYANCYRCPFSLNYPSCSLACVDEVRKQLRKSCAGGVAAFLIEPMQGTAGNVIPPKEFLPAIRKLATEMDALLICDEMITGFGRTGKYWGCDHTGVEPDILTLGKQMGGGFPLSAILSTDEIVQAKPWSNPSGSSSSYGGNPMASACAAAAIRIIDEEGLVENSRQVGEFLLQRLKPMEEKFPFVGQVRGVGLFLAIEMVKDKKTKEPMSKGSCRQVFDECLKRGLLSMSYSPHFRIQPSLCLDEKTAETVAGILEEVFTVLERSGEWKR